MIYTLETPYGPRRMGIAHEFELTGQRYVELAQVDGTLRTIMRDEGDKLTPCLDEVEFERVTTYCKQQGLGLEACADCGLPLIQGKHKRAKDCIRALSMALAAMQRIVHAIMEQAVVDPQRFMETLGMPPEELDPQLTGKDKIVEFPGRPE